MHVRGAGVLGDSPVVEVHGGRKGVVGVHHRADATCKEGDSVLQHMQCGDSGPVQLTSTFFYVYVFIFGEAAKKGKRQGCQAILMRASKKVAA